jgi:DNA repair exonuclease SbcCD ATPase subunit
MITLQTLKWDNCFSYGSGNELQLDDNTVTQILGTNGMGKSSIPLIIEEALYNKNSKGIKKADIPNRYINDGYNIYLSFTKDTDKYAITVNRKTNIKVKLEKNGTDISSHTATNTYKTLQEVLGVDFKTFSQLVYQNTNASLQFLTATDANRKKFLIDLLHLEKYVELFEVFKSASREVSAVSSTIAGKLATVEKWLEDNKLSDTNILPMLDLQIDTSEDQKTLSSLMIEIENISEKNKKISTNNQYKKMLDEIDIGAIQSSTITEYESYDELQSELGSLQAVAAGAQRTLDKLERISDECPTCKQSIDVSEETAMIEIERTKKDNAHAKAMLIGPEIKRIKANNLKFERNNKARKDWEDLLRAYSQELPANILDQAQLESDLFAVQDRLRASKKQLEENAAENERRTRLNTRIQVIQEQTDEFIFQFEEYSSKLEENSKLESNLTVLKKSFSTNGLLAYKIENLVGELEEMANEYLAELVNTATLIAIRKLMSSISKSKINILFLDEVTNVLDDQGREKLVEVLLREDLNTYIVSHGWSHPLLEKIEVVKDGNISVLE